MTKQNLDGVNPKKDLYTHMVRALGYESLDDAEGAEKCPTYNEITIIHPNISYFTNSLDIVSTQSESVMFLQDKNVTLYTCHFCC